MDVALALIVLLAQIGVIVPDCVRRTTHRDLHGTIHDGKDNYKASSVCEWLIEAPTANATIALSFTQYKTECGYDFVYVYDGDSYRNRLLASLSGDGLPPTLRARSGKMLVVLYSDANYALSGFVAHYAVEKCPYECSNAGQCVSGVCQCRYGFYGDGCEIDAFPKNCSGHGRRNATAMKCDCDEGFIGESCSFDDSEGSWNYKEHTWFALSTRRDVFTPRMSHAGVYLSTTDTVWVYGGYDANEIFGDLLVYNVKASEWNIVKNATGRGPGPRFGHTVVLWQNRLLLFGGQISTKSLTNELWQFDMNTSTWKCLVESNCTDCPKPIAGHAACMVENRMFIYGGYSPQSGFTSRLWSYDVITGKWRKEPGSGTKSSRRRVVAHSMVYHSESKQIVIFGGYTSDKLLWSKRSSALLIYHTQFQYWTLEDAEDNPVEFGRASHSGTLFGNYLLIYGGGLHQHHVREECYSPNIHAYHLGCHKWTARTSSSAFSSRSQPRGRIAHIGVKRDDATLLVIGGFYGVASSDVLALRISANLTDRPTPKTNETHCDSTQSEVACTDDPECFWCGNRTGKCQHYLLKSTCREPMQTNPCPDACVAAHNKCENCLRGVSWWPEDDPVQCGWCVQEQRCYRVNETRGRCRESASTFWWGRAQFLTAFDDCAVRDQPPALSCVCYKEPYNDSDPDLVGLIFSSRMEVFPEYTLEDQSMNTKCVARGYLRPQLLPVGSVAKEYRVRLFAAEIISATFKLGDEEASGDIVIGESGGVSDPKEIVALRSSGMPVLPATIAKPNQTFPSYYFEMTEVVKNYHSNSERRKKPKAIWLQSNVNLDVFFNGTHLSPLTTNVSRDYLEAYASGSCAQHANCMSCVSDASCSWCNHNDQCLLRAALSEDSCLRGLTSKSEYCSVCQDYNDCVSCVENGSCEWLDSHKTCGRRRGLWKAITDTKHCLKPCEKSLSCDECTRSAGCIWCSHLNLCLKSTSIISRNTFGQCSMIVGPYAAFKSCSLRDCSEAKDCNSCLDLVNCGWCGPVGDPSKGSCMRGDFQSSYDDRCSAFESERNITHLGNWEWSYGKCPDMRECELEKDSCHVNATCINTPDSYECNCNRGYRGDGLNCKRTCLHRCVEGACSEAPKYECKCKVGWTGITCNESCGCNGHSFCPEGYGICDECMHNTFGERCEFCLPGSYGNATDPEVGCKLCNCNNHSDAERGHCDRRTGMCYCVEGYRGDDCGKCNQGHYGNPLRGGKCYSECSGLTILPHRRFGSLGSAKGEGVLDPTTLSNCMWIITAVNQSELGSYSLNSSASLDAFYSASQSKRAKIIFRVDVLETSCFHDHVHVYDGLPDFLIPSHQSSNRKWEKLAAYCGSAKKKERAVVAHSGIMIVWYQGHGGGGSSPGFNGTFEIRSCADNCSGANEECDDSSACKCVTGYAGPNCDALRCPMDCGGSLCDYARDVCSDCSSCNRNASLGSVELFSRSTASSSASMKSGNLTSLPARAGHTMIYSATDDALYIFGGYSMQDGFCNDILKIIIHARTWQIIEPTGVLPEGRYFHTVVERLGSLIFMGGVTAQGTTDSVEYFDPTSKSWHKGTKCPVSVAGHTTTLMKALAVLIGGYSSLSERFNRDVMVYNTLGGSWQTYKAFGPSPKVFGHSTVQYSSFDRLIVYGGYTRLGSHGFTFSNALFVLSIDFKSSTSHWDEIFLEKPAFPEFSFHAAHLITESNSMLVIGGSSSSGSEALNTVFRIDCGDWISEPPSSLLAVTASASVYFPEKQFAIVAGGFDGGIPIGDFVVVYPTIDPCRVLESTTCATIPGCVECQKREGCVSTGDPTSQCVEGTERPQSNCSMPLEPKTACSQLKSCQSCLFSQLSCHWCPCLDTCVTDEIYCSQCSAVSQIEQCPVPVQACTKLTNSRDCVARSDCTWKQQSCANSTGDSPCSQKTTCADCAGADGCAWSSGLKTCLPEVELPLACVFGRCERVALAPTECPRSCARNTHCRACIQDLGCGWCAKPDGSGNGTCMEGTIDGSTSDVQCDLSSNVSSAVFGFWSYMKCPKEDECRNNHHTCRSDQICKNTDDSFDCQCNDGYEEDPGRDRCIPACKQSPCKHGICVRPEECECEFGYVGAACDKECDCNGAGHCSDESTEGLKNCTECRNNTRGPQCSQCDPFYVGRSGHCVPCRDVCHKNSDVCVDKEQIKRLDLSLSLTQREVQSILNLTRGPDQSSNVICLGCRNHSRGDRCDECVEGYFNEEGIVSKRRLPKIVGCRPCFCNGHSSRCDAETGLRCQCSNHTRTLCDETDPLCYRYQCAECAASYMGNATDGFPCYEKVSVGFLKQVSSGAQSRLFGIWPNQVNVDIHLTIWILNGTSDVYVGTGNHDVRLTVDRRTGEHAARFTTDSYELVSGGGGDDDYKPTVVRMHDVEDRLFLRQFRGQLRVIIPYESFSLQSQKFFVALLGTSDDYRSFVYFRQDSPEINLFIFFSVFFSGFFLFLAFCVLVWKLKQEMDRRRMVHLEAIEMEERKRRPTGKTSFLCEREIPIAGRFKFSSKRSVVVSPVAVQSTDDGRARVGTFLFQLPGSPFDPMNISLASALLAKSFKDVRRSSVDYFPIADRSRRLKRVSAV